MIGVVPPRSALDLVLWYMDLSRSNYIRIHRIRIYGESPSIPSPPLPYPTLRDLTLLDPAATSEEPGPAAAAARQALVFADERGRADGVDARPVAETRDPCSSTPVRHSFIFTAHPDPLSFLPLPGATSSSRPALAPNQWNA